MLTLKQTFKLNIASFDLLKGCMILGVFLTHVFEGISFWMYDDIHDSYNSIIRSGFGAMPAFLMISGYVFKAKDPKKILKSTFTSLCVPCMWVAGITMLIAPVTYYLFQYQNWEATAYEMVCRLLGYVLGLPGPDQAISFLGFELYSCGPIWFLWTLFVAQNMLNLILLHLKKTWKQIIAVLICAAAGLLLFQWLFLFYCIPQGLVAVGFCYAGHLMKRYNVIQRFIYDIRTYFLLVPIALAEWKWGYFYMWDLSYNNIILEYVGVAGSAVLMILASLWIGQFEWRITDPLKELGVYSFWFLAVHNVEMYVFPWRALESLWGDRPDLYLILMIFVRLALILAGVTVIKRISRYNYARKSIKRKAGQGQ